VSAAEDMGTAVLGPIVAEMTARHPRVRIDLVFSNAYVDLVKEGFDLALRIGELSDTTLIARRIGFVSSMLVASPSYLKKADRITRLSDLERHPTLHFSVPHHDDIWSLRGDRKSEERVRVRPLCRASNPRILIELALAGRGIALAPEFLCFEELRAGRLKRVLPNYRADVRPVSFVWPKQIELSLKVRELVDIGVKRLSRCFRRQELAQ
jgi:DNA-binding transcriptional LysR family regulator